MSYSPATISNAILLQWTPPTQFDGDSLLQYEVTLTPLEVGPAAQLRYILPATQSQLTAQGLQTGEEYQVEIETRVDSGLLQPFYSRNITIPITPASSAAVANGAAGAGVVLLVVLVCVAVVGVVVLMVYFKWRKGANKREGTGKKGRYNHAYYVAGRLMLHMLCVNILISTVWNASNFVT